jgi:hypothetical protein
MKNNDPAGKTAEIVKAGGNTDAAIIN